MKKFEYQWREVTRCKENSHIMPALDAFGEDGWEAFKIDSNTDRDGKSTYGIWMRREVEAPDQPAES